LVNTTGASEIITSDSTGEIVFDDCARNKSSLRIRMPASGRYSGINRNLDFAVSDIANDIGFDFKKLAQIRVNSLSSLASVNSFVSGSVPPNVRRVSAYENRGGWSSGASTAVTSPIGTLDAFEVTTQAVMIASGLSSSGSACVQFWAKSNNTGSGSFDVSILRNSDGGLIDVVLGHFNGVSDWVLLSTYVDLSLATGGIRLIFPSASNIYFWGQQITEGTKYPVPFLPFNRTNVFGYQVNDIKSLTSLNQSYDHRAQPGASPQVYTSPLLATLAYEQFLGSSYQVVIQQRHSSEIFTNVWHVNLGYSNAYDPAKAAVLISSPYSGAAFVSRIGFTASSLTANTDKALVFTTTGFINELRIKVSSLL
jgi:hypothetical protein